MMKEIKSKDFSKCDFTMVKRFIRQSNHNSGLLNLGLCMYKVKDL